MSASASDFSGYFFIGYEGHWSEKIVHDASADDVASALAGIPAVGAVTVRKEEIYVGYTLEFPIKGTSPL